MNPSDNELLEAYLPVYDAVPAEWKDARPFIVEQLKRIATAINIREIGWFLDQEVLSGKAFIPGMNAASFGATSQIYRQVLRKVIIFGALPNATTKSVAHGITFDANFRLVFMGAYATDPVGLTAVPIPYVDPSTLANGIELYIDATNVNIKTAANWTNYTICYVTIEYLQEP